MEGNTNMNLYRAWFEGTSVRFSISHSQMCFFDTNRITELAQGVLQEEGCDVLFSEVQWEEL